MVVISYAIINMKKLTAAILLATATLAPAGDDPVIPLDIAQLVIIDNLKRAGEDLSMYRITLKKSEVLDSKDGRNQRMFLDTFLVEQTVREVAFDVEVALVVMPHLNDAPKPAPTQ
jgi:hypothetical protein